MLPKIKLGMGRWLKEKLPTFRWKPIGDWRNRWARAAGFVALGWLIFLTVPLFLLMGLVKGAEEWWEQMDWLLAEAHESWRKGESE